MTLKPKPLTLMGYAERDGKICRDVLLWMKEILV